MATDGPATVLATTPVSTKMPVPMMTPTPKTVRSSAERCRRSLCSGSSVSRMESSTDLIRRVPAATASSSAPAVAGSVVVLVLPAAWHGYRRRRMPTLTIRLDRRTIGWKEPAMSGIDLPDAADSATSDRPHRTPRTERPSLRPRAAGAPGYRRVAGTSRRPSSAAPSTSTGVRQEPVAPEHALRGGHRTRRLRLAGPVRAHRRPSSRSSPRGTACTRWPSRTRCTPTSGPSSSATTTPSSWC